MIKLEPFDLLFCKEKSLTTKLITLVDKSEYSHVCVVLDKHHIFEIQYNMNASIRHIPYNLKDYDIYRVTEYFNQDLFLEFIYNHIKCKYDYIEILKILFKMKNISDDDGKYICSTIINDAFKYSGLELSYNKVSSISDLLKSEYLIKINKER